ncbi:MAG: immunity 49 family protein [Polyangiaceae bacterium]|nr:immunity 49 family protein [Polyangiaceae bacterium]
MQPLRKYPHAPEQGILAERLSRSLADVRETTPGLNNANRPLNGRLPIYLADMHLHIAALKHGFSHALNDVQAHFNDSAAYTLQALREDIAMGPGQYRIYLAVANIANHAELRSFLENAPRERFTDPAIHADVSAYDVCKTSAHLSANHTHDAQPLIQSALVRLQSGQVNRYAVAALMPILAIQAAIANGDQNGLQRAVAARCTSFAADHKKRDTRHDPEGLLDVVALGLIAVARRVGLNVDIQSPYLPLDLLK